MKKTKVYLGILSTGQREDYHMYLFDQLRKRYEDEIELVLPESCVWYFGHDFARNEYVKNFLESDCDVLWFLDSDVVPPNHILDLITVHGDKWEAAGAPYPLWLSPPGKEELAVCFTAYNGVCSDTEGKARSIKMASVPKTGTEFVDGLATGCLFIKREVFSKLKKPYFEFKRNPETMEITEGEDLGFAIKLSNLGIKFFCDHGMVCKHYKRVDLLDVNNYATSFANNKLIEFDRQIRSQVELACQAAYRKGAEDALKQISAGAVTQHGPKRTQSGLILPT